MNHNVFYVGIPVMDNGEYTRPLSFAPENSEEYFLMLDDDFIEEHPACWPVKTFEEVINRIDEYRNYDEEYKRFSILRCYIPELTSKMLGTLADGIVGGGTNRDGIEVRVTEIMKLI